MKIPNRIYTTIINARMIRVAKQKAVSCKRNLTKFKEQKFFCKPYRKAVRVKSTVDKYFRTGKYHKQRKTSRKQGTKTFIFKDEKCSGLGYS